MLDNVEVRITVPFVQRTYEALHGNIDEAVRRSGPFASHENPTQKNGAFAHGLSNCLGASEAGAHSI